MIYWAPCTAFSVLFVKLGGISSILYYGYTSRITRAAPGHGTLDGSCHHPYPTPHPHGHTVCCCGRTGGDRWRSIAARFDGMEKREEQRRIFGGTFRRASQSATVPLRFFGGAFLNGFIPTCSSQLVCTSRARAGPRFGYTPHPVSGGAKQANMRALNMQ